jgi:biotinidase
MEQVSNKFTFTVRYLLIYFTANQIQQNWAYTNDVNLLASGANKYWYGATGSGIYAGRLGPVISIISPTEKM